MKKIYARIAIVFCMMLFPMICTEAHGGASAEAERVITELQKRYESIDSLEAAFTQEVVSRHTKSAEKYEGTVYLKKPGKMKWVYAKPANDVIVSNGKTMWIYQSDLNQVFETRVGKAASNLAIDFLSGLGSVRKDFELTKEEDKGTVFILKLVPRTPQPNMMRLTIEVDKKSWFAVRATIEDSFANTTRLTFRDIKTPEARQDSFFEYTPPKGAKVLKP